MADLALKTAQTLDLSLLNDEEFESLVAAIFRAKILRPPAGQKLSPESFGHTVVSVSHSGRGADEGRDLTVTTWVSDCVVARQFTWLVQCKHNAKSKRSVQLRDFGGDPFFADVVAQHGADGYLIVCSTRPSKNLQSRFDALTASAGNPYHFVIWDGARVCEEAHKHHDLIKQFFPDYYRMYLQKDIEFEDVVEWLQREGVSAEKRSLLNAALSEVTPDESADAGRESGEG
ncbi:MAG: restriction endonuclease [Acidobacteriota bacterium]|nr:restriction endonuclease [Acidobacteriota bacterium]